MAVPASSPPSHSQRRSVTPSPRFCSNHPWRAHHTFPKIQWTTLWPYFSWSLNRFKNSWTLLSSFLFNFILYWIIIINFIFLSDYLYWIILDYILYWIIILDYIGLYYYIGFILDYIDLQCCVSFRCTAKWFSYTYTHIHSFSDSFPVWVITEYWVEFPVLCSRSLLIIYFTYSGIYLLIPNS